MKICQIVLERLELIIARFVYVSWAPHSKSSNRCLSSSVNVMNQLIIIAL